MGRGRSKSKKRRKAASEYSNHRLPTFSDLTRSLDSMVGLPDLSVSQRSLVDIPIFDPHEEYQYSYSEYRHSPSVVTGGLLAPEMTSPGVLPVTSPVAPDSPPIPRDEALEECTRRSIRKEIIHALGHAGKGGQKTPIWTDKSKKIKC